jgi:hypothetical protein
MLDSKKASKDKIILRKRRNFFEISREGQRKCRHHIKEKTNDLNMFLKSMGLQFKCIEIVRRNDKVDEDFEIKIMNKTVTKFKTEETKTLLLDALKAVDEANMSEQSYRGFKKTMKLPSMPTLYRIRAHRSRLNSFFDLKQNDFGHYVDARQKIEYVLKKIYKKETTQIKDDTFFLKFSGDGTNITKTSVQLLNFTFTVLNDKGICKTSSGNYILGEK